MTWRDEVRRCVCGESCSSKREAQAYCTKRCANAATQRRKRSGDKGLAPSLTRPPRLILKRSATALRWFGQLGMKHQGPTPGALQGDDYPLEYDSDGHPELPTCLDRRVTILAKAA